MKKIAVHQILVVVATIAVVAVNALANILPINGQNTGEISDRFAIYFVPAGYVFSIWGLIYLGLIAYTIYQALPAQRENQTLKRIGLYYIVGNLANIAWIFMWHYLKFQLTLPMMLTILVTLILTYLVLREDTESRSAAFKWFVRAPMSLYLGWISVATVANVTQVLFYNNWTGWGISPEIWTVLMLIIAAAIAALMILRERDLVYAAVFVWAYAGIQNKHSATPVVAITALVLAVLIAVLMGLQLLRVFPGQKSLAKPGTRAA